MKKDLIVIIDDLLKRLSFLKERLELDIHQKEYDGLEKKMQESSFWDDAESATKVSQRASYLKDFIDSWKRLFSDTAGFTELLEMATEEEVVVLSEEVYSLQNDLEKAEIKLLLSGEYDRGNVLLSLHVGNGGQDAEDFCQMLQRMFFRYAEQKGWKVKILEESKSSVGLKSCLCEIKGDFAYGFLRSEHGVHRLIRLSPFNAKSLRQTSFARVEILPEIEDDDKIELDENDLKIDVFRSSGAGGQSVNTTDSAVRITYLPLNLVVTCQNEKSQLQNKQAALKVLKSRLARLQIEQRTKELNELRGDLVENSFGSQIRTYTLQPYKLVKDHRTNFENSNPDKVFDGDLDGFIQSFLKKI